MSSSIPTRLGPMARQLLADITRCHDDSCLQRHDCLRWLQRSSGERAATTMRRDFHTCPSFLSATARTAGQQGRDLPPLDP